MNARNMLKALTLALTVLVGTSSAGMTGCIQRTIIEEPIADDSTNAPAPAASSDGQNAVANHALYVKSGQVRPGETQSGPFPEPWEQRLGPFPEPWQREGSGEGDDGTSPPPPSDPNPNPDPNPKP